MRQKPLARERDVLGDVGLLRGMRVQLNRADAERREREVAVRRGRTLAMARPVAAAILPRREHPRHRRPSTGSAARRRHRAAISRYASSTAGSSTHEYCTASVEVGVRERLCRVGARDRLVERNAVLAGRAVGERRLVLVMTRIAALNFEPVLLALLEQREVARRGVADAWLDQHRPPPQPQREAAVRIAAASHFGMGWFYHTSGLILRYAV